MIELTDVTKTFNYRGQKTVAVDHLNLSILAGQIVGLVGPNGAGKTTTMRMLSTLSRPTSGSITVNGHDTTQDASAVRSRLGYVPQRGAVLPESRVIDELVFQGALFGMTRTAATARAESLIGSLELTGLENRKAQQLSGGQRRRVDIALGLMHTPTTVLLDEPTVGLDPQSRANLWQHIRTLRDDFGTTVILATHYLDEAERLTDRVAVIDHGKVIADGPPAELISTLSKDEIVFSLTDDVKVAAALTELGPEFEPTVVDKRVSIRVKGAAAAAAPQLLRRLSTSGVEVESLEINRANLDDIFLSLTGRTLRD
jgi:ABC-2 type transport system ATP-binding protein